MTTEVPFIEGQLSLPFTEVASVVGPLSPATCLLGRTEVARLKEMLASLPPAPPVR